MKRHVKPVERKPTVEIKDSHRGPQPRGDVHRLAARGFVIRWLYEIDGFSLSEIGGILGINPSTVKQAAVQQGVKLRAPQGAIAFRPQLVNIICVLYEEFDRTMRALGRLCGVSHTVIRRLLVSQGVELRDE